MWQYFSTTTCSCVLTWRSMVSSDCCSVSSGWASWRTVRTRMTHLGGLRKRALRHPSKRMRLSKRRRLSSRRMRSSSGERRPTGVVIWRMSMDSRRSYRRRPNITMITRRSLKWDHQWRCPGSKTAMILLSWMRLWELPTRIFPYSRDRLRSSLGLLQTTSITIKMMRMDSKRMMLNRKILRRMQTRTKKKRVRMMRKMLDHLV